jgi:CPA2 family monovalent cation:H+ antiporter-2
MLESQPVLLVNLVFALGACLVGALLAARLHQSVILGYIVAGMAIGPFTPGFVGDAAAVGALADVGIIFLMFAVGLQVSLHELAAGGKVATIGAVVQIALLIGMGYVAGIAFGWRPVEALFFGAVISISSSIVLTKVLGERGEADSGHGRLALAWSAVQDLAVVVLVIVLGALAGQGEKDPLEFLTVMGKAGLFLAIMGVVGLRAMPLLFERVAALHSREVFILTVAAVALGTAYASSFFGLSLALGAFIAGVMVSESDLSHQILGEVIPLRDIFAGLFFVSVGMLVDPTFVVENVLLVLAVIVLILAKGGVVAGLAAIAGQPTRTAVLAGASLAPSAEFSFLLAGLGLHLDALSQDVYSLMLAASAVTIVLAPNLYGAALPFTGWLARRMPTSEAEDEIALELKADSRIRGHAVICGYGRVGRIIGAALRRRGFRYVVIELDQRRVRRLRAQGVTALTGDASNPVILERVGLERAQALIIAVPDPIAARQVVDYARRVNPRLDIVVRTHSAGERRFLQGRVSGEVVLGELELALEMARHALHRFGVSSIETQSIVNGLRQRVSIEGQDEMLEH